MGLTYYGVNILCYFMFANYTDNCNLRISKNDLEKEETNKKLVFFIFIAFRSGCFSWLTFSRRIATCEKKTTKQKDYKNTGFHKMLLSLKLIQI